MQDRIDRLLGQWAAERPELDCSGLAVVARMQAAAKLLRRSEDAVLAKLGLTMREYDVLSVLCRQGKPYRLRMSAIARESLLSTAAMTNRIDRLERRGLVRRETDPADRRSVLVGLTPAGLALVGLAIESRLGAAETHLAALSRGERHRVAAGLRKLVGAAD
jgi:DNA-binding MarR family transcriptional regulator